MRVAVFTDNDFDKINGVTTALTAVLRRAPSDIQPRIYTAATLGCDQPDYLALPSRGVGIPFYRHMKMYVPHWKQYLARVIADRVDVLHLTTPGPMGLVALWIRKKTGLPMVGSFHTDLAAYTELLSGSDRLGVWMREYMRWMYGCCDRVFVPSESTRRLLVAAKGRPDRIRIWSRGVDTVLFSPARRSARLRESWNVSDDRPAVLYVGRLSKEKGVEMFPALQSMLTARGIQHRLILVGDGPMRKELAEQCPGAVLPGELGRDDVATAFASADVFVFPSRTDTAGNVVLEAQACALPVLVSDAGGPQENIRADLSGTVCRGAGIESWVEAIGGLLLSAPKRRAMGQEARAFALSRQWDAALAPLYQGYREVCEGRSNRAA
jgi:glycosyltransferase involved in cell wall biosynthesis